MKKVEVTSVAFTWKKKQLLTKTDTITWIKYKIKFILYSKVLADFERLKSLLSKFGKSAKKCSVCWLG